MTEVPTRLFTPKDDAYYAQQETPTNKSTEATKRAKVGGSHKGSQTFDQSFSRRHSLAF